METEVIFQSSPTQEYVDVSMKHGTSIYSSCRSIIQGHHASSVDLNFKGPVFRNIYLSSFSSVQPLPY